MEGTSGSNGGEMSLSRHQEKFLFGATLQSRRWLMDQRLKAVEQNDMCQLRELFASRRPFHAAELTAALETAVLKKSDTYSPCVRLLLDKGANPGGVNGAGAPYLYIAADAGCVQIVDLLLRANCDVNQRKDDGSTALHRAVTNNHRDVVTRLMTGGADVEQRDVQGRTPVILASQRDRNDILDALLRAGADVNASDKKRRSALYWAARYNYTDVMTSLLRHDVDIDGRDWQQYTALMKAAEYGHRESVEMLLDHDADTDVINHQAMSALMIATTHKYTHCITLLVDFGADVNIRDSYGASPIMYLMDCPVMVYHLLEAGADPNMTLYNTPLSPSLIAIADNSYHSLTFLLQANTDFTCVYRDGHHDGHHDKRALDEALRRGYVTCVHVLFLASLCVGDDLFWLRTKLQTWSEQNPRERRSQVAKCHVWLMEEMQAVPPVPSLFNLTRGKLRRCIPAVFYEDNVESLPLPCVLKNALKLRELDTVIGSEH